MVAVESKYRAAFEDFSLKAQRVQELTEHPTGDRREFEAALVELEKAHLAYGEARDAVVQSLAPAAPVPAAKDDHRSDVRTYAELLWESAGRPTGTAEQDWQRAEAIVQTAVDSACVA